MIKKEHIFQWNRWHHFVLISWVRIREAGSWVKELHNERNSGAHRNPQGFLWHHHQWTQTAPCLCDNTKGKKRVQTNIYLLLCVYKDGINWWDLHNIPYVKFVVPGQPNQTPLLPEFVMSCQSTPVLSCLQTVPSGAADRGGLGLTAVTVQWRSMPMYRTCFPPD